MGRSTARQVEADALEFGTHVKQGGYRLGLLVARNVKSSEDSSSNKVTPTEWSRLSKTRRETVIQHLKGWNRAAEDGVVPPSWELVPGEELDGLDIDKLPPWSTYYDAYSFSEERNSALEAQAKEDGVGYSKVRDIAKNRNAMAAAIKGDEATLLAAREAIAEADAKAGNVPSLTPAQVKQAYKSNPKAREAVREAVHERVQEKVTEDRLQAMARGEKPRAPKEPEPAPEITWGEGLQEEVDRRNAITAYLDWAHDGADIVEAVLSYGPTGVEDEVEWITQANDLLSTYRIKTNDNIVGKPAARERR